ncbi:hypothetical protein J3458_005202 [Metarhizium acridum]|uniref:uncharacterized protein n=1 Tax=Metarhizium acridum TaxID=92637 RepID=UPI001C6B0D02|nr:hypothetical protein J3458_005202 [Metarhizium acridum]
MDRTCRNRRSADETRHAPSASTSMSELQLEKALITENGPVLEVDVSNAVKPGSLVTAEGGRMLQLPNV